MNTTVRRIAVSGSAAVALLGGAAAISMSTAPDASATEISTVIDRAAGAPVNLPDGRVMHVRGLDSAGYQADAAHHTAVVRLADGTNPGVGTYNDQTGTGTNLQNPTVGNGVNYTPTQVQASAGGISITVAVGIGLLIVCIVMIRSRKVGGVQAAILVMLGIYLAPTFVGPLAQQLGSTFGTSLGNIWSGMG